MNPRNALVEGMSGKETVGWGEKSDGDLIVGALLTGKKLFSVVFFCFFTLLSSCLPVYLCLLFIHSFAFILIFVFLSRDNNKQVLQQKKKKVTITLLFLS